MKSKTKKQQLKDSIIRQLRDEYRVTDKELQSGSFYFCGSAVLAEEVLPRFEAQYGVVLEKREFLNWQDFAEKLATAVCEK